MFRPISFATILFTGVLTTAGTIAFAEKGSAREVASVSAGADAPSEDLAAADAAQGAWSGHRSQRDDEDSDRQKRRRGRVDHRDDEDSDSERRRRSRVGHRDDEDSDSERRHGRIGNRDRDRDNDRSARRRNAGRSGIAFDNGSSDGYDRGRADVRDGSQHDPVRHRQYRSADRGYDSRIGSREQYRNAYRDGFRDGYESGYRDGENSRRSRNGRTQWPWPF